LSQARAAGDMAVSRREDDTGLEDAGKRSLALQDVWASGLNFLPWPHSR
jgi:hypothetical protein